MEFVEAQVRGENDEVPAWDNLDQMNSITAAPWTPVSDAESNPRKESRGAPVIQLREWIARRFESQPQF